jgi:hypothetical protein
VWFPDETQRHRDTETQPQRQKEFEERGERRTKREEVE